MLLRLNLKFVFNAQIEVGYVMLSGRWISQCLMLLTVVVDMNEKS